MIEIMRSNDAVALSFAESLLSEAGIACFVADQHMSILEGSVGILQRRLMVDRDAEARARRLLTDAGLGDELRPQ